LPRLDPGSGVPYTLTGTPFSVAEDWFRYTVFNNSAYDVGALSFADVAKAFKIDPGATNSWKGDLSAFKRRGGKLIRFMATKTRSSCRQTRRGVTTMSALQ
jgi:feruloyl esterase